MTLPRLLAWAAYQGISCRSKACKFAHVLLKNKGRTGSQMKERAKHLFLVLCGRWFNRFCEFAETKPTGEKPMKTMFEDERKFICKQIASIRVLAY
jgi:hypothetical protein